jgi:hypothetical protein
MQSIINKPAIILGLGIIILFLPVLVLDYGVIYPNPEHYWTGTTKEHFGHFLQDPLGSIIELAYAGYSKNELLAGRFPLWSPFQGTGHPFVADIPSSAIFAPLNLLRILLPDRYWSYIFVVNLFLGCIFIYLLCRSYGIADFAAIPAGLSFAALGTTQVYLSVSSVIMVAAWVPLLLYGIERILSDCARRWTWLPFLVGIYGVVTGGHPTITLLAGIFAATYTGVRITQLRPSIRRVALLVSSAALGVLITAIQWIPFVAYVAYRGNTFRDYSALHFDFRHLPALIVPYIYGPLNSTGTSTSPTIFLGQYWSLGWIPPVLLVFITAGLLAVGTRRQMRSAPVALVVVTGVFLLWAFGAPPFGLTSKLPFFNRVRGHYIAVTVAFALSVVAGCGLHALASSRVKLWRASLAAGVAFGLASALAVWVLTAGGIDFGTAISYISPTAGYALLWAVAPVVILLIPLRKQSHNALEFVVLLTSLTLVGLCAIAFSPWASDAAVQHTRRSALVSLGVAAAVLSLATLRHRRMTVCAAMAVVAGSRLWVATTPQHLPRKQDLFELPQYARFLQERMMPQFRAYGFDAFLFPNFSSAARISSLNILTGIVSTQVEQFSRTFLDDHQTAEVFMGIHDAGLPNDPPVAQYLKRKRFYDYLGVRFVVARPTFATQQRGLDGRAIPLMQRGTPQVLAHSTSSPLQCPQTDVGGLCVYLGTYGRVNPGRLRLYIRNDRGEAIATSEIDSGAVSDLACQPFDLPAGVCSRPAETLYVELMHEKATVDSALAVFRLSDDKKLDFHLLSRSHPELSRVYIDPDSGGQVWESVTAKPRVYIAPTTSVAESWEAAQTSFGAQTDLRRRAFVDSNSGCTSNENYPVGKDAGRLVAMNVDSDRVVADIEAFTPGTFVLVDAFAPGWKANVDGKDAHLFRVNGVFRGTCIASPGRHRITMEYSPTHWRVATITTGVGIALAIGLALVARSNTPV